MRSQRQPLPKKTAVPAPEVDVVAVLGELLPTLVAGEPGAATNAAAALVLLASRNSPPPELLQAVPVLTVLVGADVPALQQNACAALTGIFNGCIGGRESATAEGAAARFAAALTAEAIPTRLNAAEALAALVGEGGIPLDAAIAAGVPGIVVGLLQEGGEERQQEAVTDLMCALACDPAPRAPLLQAGALAALVALLVPSASIEVKVRALMAVSMLCSAADAATQLVALPGAVAAITGIMRDGEGEDRIIAAELFKCLLAQPELRDAVRAAVQAASTTAGA